MRYAFAIAALLILAPSAQAQNASTYPWCAEYGNGNGGRNCGFQTLRQCKAAISGDSTASCIRIGGRR